MVKSRNMNKRSKNGNTVKSRNRSAGSGGIAVRRAARQVRPRMGLLDEWGAKWARLLADPCGAPMVQGCYPGGGSGMLIRVKNLVPVLTGLNDCFQFSYTPGFNKFVLGQTVGAATGVMSVTQAAFPTLLQYDAFRAVAACARVVYIGTEGSRSGQIGSAISQSSIIEASQPGVGSFQLYGNMQKISRLGEVIHETKWIPSIEDGNFIGAADVGSSHHRGTITIVGLLLPAASAYIELTSVYEVIPEISSGLTVSQTVPPSRNSIGDVLRSLGDAAGWAFSNVVAPVIKASAGMAVQANMMSPQLLAGATRLALSY